MDEKGLSTGSIDKIPQNGKGLDYSNASEHRLIGDSYPEGGIGESLSLVLVSSSEEQSGLSIREIVDRNFLFNPSSSNSSSSKSSSPLSSTPQVILTAPSISSSSQSKRIQLSFSSSLPSVQIYSAPSLDGTGPLRKDAHQNSESKKKGYEANGALFIEFQQPVGTFTYTCAEDKKDGNELESWLERRWKEEGGGDEGRTWEKDSLLRLGQVWESWVEVDVKMV